VSSIASVNDVLTAWREFLNDDEREGETPYRVYHASFQDFLADEVGLVTYHEAIGETALSKIPRLRRGRLTAVGCRARWRRRSPCRKLDALGH
jgi:hypothetical protein